MSKISDKLNIISSAKDDIKTAIENKGVTVGTIGIQEYANKINEMEVAVPIEKGFIINVYDNNGYATDVSVVGMTSIPNYAFGSNNTSYSNFLTKKVVNVNLPNGLVSIGQYAFAYCTELNLTMLPQTLTTINRNAFQSCYKLAIKELPAGITKINDQALKYCRDNLTELTCLGDIVYIGLESLAYCNNLTKLVLPNTTSVPALNYTNTFNSTPIQSGTGYVYFPDDLVEDVKVATNWSAIADQILPISQLPTE